VVVVVEADADQLSGLGHRSVERDLVEWDYSPLVRSLSSEQIGQSRFLIDVK